MAAVTATRIPLNTVAIAFGLAGLAELRSTAGKALGWSPVATAPFWLITAIAWVWLLAAHLARGAKTRLPLLPQLRDPAQGPPGAIVPVVAMLLGAALLPAAPIAGRIVIGAALLTTATFAAWLISVWIRGGRPADALHGGYFLPTVAAGFIAADASQQAGWHAIALGTFAGAPRAATTVAWRPDAVTPTLAIMIAPPAVGGLAWFAISGGRIDALQQGLLGILLLMLLAQVFLLPTYLRLRFTLGFWSFTFPTAGAGTYAIEWIDRIAPTALVAVTVVVLVIVTGLVAAISGKSFAGWAADRRASRPIDEVRELLDADTAVDHDADTADALTRQQ